VVAKSAQANQPIEYLTSRFPKKIRIYRLYKFKRALSTHEFANTQYLNWVHINVYTNPETNVFFC